MKRQPDPTLLDLIGGAIAMIALFIVLLFIAI
jgi:hypothetical protein